MGLRSSKQDTELSQPPTTPPLLVCVFVCPRYASFDYEEGEYRAADLVRLDILAHGKVVDALARLVHRVRRGCVVWSCNRGWQPVL